MKENIYIHEGAEDFGPSYKVYTLLRSLDEKGANLTSVQLSELATTLGIAPETVCQLLEEALQLGLLRFLHIKGDTVTSCYTSSLKLKRQRKLIPSTSIAHL